MHNPYDAKQNASRDVGVGVGVVVVVRLAQRSDANRVALSVRNLYGIYPLRGFN